MPYAMIYNQNTGVEVFKGDVEEDKNGNPIFPENLEIVEEHSYKICLCFVTTGAEFIGD